MSNAAEGFGYLNYCIDVCYSPYRRNRSEVVFNIVHAGDFNIAVIHYLGNLAVVAVDDFGAVEVRAVKELFFYAELCKLSSYIAAEAVCYLVVEVENRL